MDSHRLSALAAVLTLGLLAGCSDDTPLGGGLGAASDVDEWTMLGQDLSSTFNNTGEKVLSVETVARLREAWRHEARGTITGGPAVKAGVVYTLSSGGVAAFRAADGALLWENTEVAGTSSPAISDGMLFLNDADAVVHALDAATGAEIWRAVVDPHRFASGFSSPVVFERYVIVGSASGEEGAVATGATFRGSVVAFDRDTGAEIWRHYTVEPPGNGVAVWASVSIDPETRTVFAATGNNYTEEATGESDAIFALDLDTGALVWLTQLTEGDVFTILNPQSPDTDFGTNPILFTAEIGGERRRLVGAGQKAGVFWALDRDTGEVLWSRAVSPGSALLGGMLNNGAFDGEHVIVAGNHCRDAAGQATTGICNVATSTTLLAALDPSDGHSVWERELRSWVWAPVTIANGVGYVAVDQSVEAFDVATGELLFEFATAGTIAAAPTVAEGRLHIGSGLAYFVGTPNRMLHVLSLDGQGGGGNNGGPTFEPTFSAIFEEIFVADGCNTTSCHGGNQGNLSMNTRDQAYANLVGTPAAGASCAASGLVRVVAGDPAASLLLDKVSSTTPVCGTAMPPAGPLDERQVEQIREWIARGALDD
jgi:polyvinyl alcohol dehydrogenase (cytochrome)